MTCCSGIKSSSSISKSDPRTISVRRSSPCLCFTSNNSSRIIAWTRSSFAKISFKSAINATNPWYSSSILPRSNPVKRRKRISKIAFPWRSDNENSDINEFNASSSVDEPRIIAIIRSIWSKAIRSPSKIWARSSALFKSNCVRRTITSTWCLIYAAIISFKFKTLGCPSTSANILIP